MSFDIMKQVETLGQNLLKLQDIDEQFGISLQKELSGLADQVSLLLTLDSVYRLVKSNADLPIRRINYNIKKLSEDSQPRWIDLLQLECEPLIFCIIAFNGLASLPDRDYNWLVQNVQDYVRKRKFPRYWILRDQIRKAVANTPRRDNTKQFIEKYHKAEMDWCRSSNSPADRSLSSSSSKKRKHIQEVPDPSTDRRIEYRYSEAPMSLVPRLGDRLSSAVQSSQQWKWERGIGGRLLTTDCLNALAPKNRNHDISITLWVGFEEGTKLIEEFQLVPR